LNSFRLEKPRKLGEGGNSLVVYSLTGTSLEEPLKRLSHCTPNLELALKVAESNIADREIYNYLRLRRCNIFQAFIGFLQMGNQKKGLVLVQFRGTLLEYVNICCEQNLPFGHQLDVLIVYLVSFLATIHHEHYAHRDIKVYSVQWCFSFPRSLARKYPD